MDFILAFGLIVIDMLLGIGLALTIRQNKDLTDVCQGYEKEINDCQTKIKGLMIRDNAQDMVTKKLSNDYSKIVKNSDDLKYWAYSNVETWKSQTHFRTHDAKHAKAEPESATSNE